MVLLSSLNARTDHDVRSNKLRHKKSTTPNIIPSRIYSSVVDKSMTKCYFLIELKNSVDHAYRTVEDTCKLTPGGGGAVS